jgi:antirestriction protein ArdC
MTDHALNPTAECLVPRSKELHRVASKMEKIIMKDLALNFPAAYIDHWMKAIRADEKAVMIAAGQAQKAADFILGTNSVEAADQGN